MPQQVSSLFALFPIFDHSRKGSEAKTNSLFCLTVTFLYTSLTRASYTQIFSGMFFKFGHVITPVYLPPPQLMFLSPLFLSSWFVSWQTKWCHNPRKRCLKVFFCSLFISSSLIVCRLGFRCLTLFTSCDSRITCTTPHVPLRTKALVLLLRLCQDKGRCRRYPYPRLPGAGYFHHFTINLQVHTHSPTSSEGRAKKSLRHVTFSKYLWITSDNAMCELSVCRSHDHRLEVKDFQTIGGPWRTRTSLSATEWRYAGCDVCDSPHRTPPSPQERPPPSPAAWFTCTESRDCSLTLSVARRLGLPRWLTGIDRHEVGDVEDVEVKINVNKI